jgi:hypothetical protein
VTLAGRLIMQPKVFYPLGDGKQKGGRAAPIRVALIKIKEIEKLFDATNLAPAEGIAISQPVVFDPDAPLFW